MKLYHGSYIEFDTIDLSRSQRGKDFGQGFYLSDDKEQSEKMTIFKSLVFNTKPVVLEYEFDEELLKDGTLSFLSFENYTKEWADFVFKNRNNKTAEPIHSFDVVYGPIANDKVGVQIRNLIEGNIDFNVFLERLKYMKGITFQYFFGTEKAINYLRRI